MGQDELRGAVPQELREAADRRHDEIVERGGDTLHRLKTSRVPAVLRSQAPHKRKVMMLAKIADEAAAIIGPSTPCRRGCSACCYQAVPIGRAEAEVLSAASGRPMDLSKAKPLNMATVINLRGNQDVYLQNPKPCPFLVDHACSVYEHRPVTCRTHHVLHNDASRCDLFRARDGGVPVPLVKFDLRWIDESMAMMMMFDDVAADIRDFFPT